MGCLENAAGEGQGFAVQMQGHGGRNGDPGRGDKLAMGQVKGKGDLLARYIGVGQGLFRCRAVGGVGKQSGTVEKQQQAKDGSMIQHGVLPQIFEWGGDEVHDAP